MMAEANQKFLHISEGYAGDKAAEKVLSHFRNEEPRHEFYQFFRELADIYEILSPDAFLRPYIDDYDQLSRMYRLLRSAYDTAFVDRELTRKTARLVQEHTRGGTIQDSLEIYEINEKLLERLEKDDTPDTVKIFNLLKSIQELINKEKHQAPYLLTIGERAEAIAQAYQLRQKNTQEALKELEKLIRDINQAEKERAEKNLKPAAFAIYYVLNQDDLPDAEEIAREMEKSFEEYPHWEFSPAQERDVRIELYKVLLNSKAKKELKSSKTKETNELTLLVEKLMRVAGRAGNNK